MIERERMRQNERGAGERHTQGRMKDSKGRERERERQRKVRESERDSERKSDSEGES